MAMIGFRNIELFDPENSLKKRVDEYVHFLKHIIDAPHPFGSEHHGLDVGFHFSVLKDIFYPSSRMSILSTSHLRDASNLLRTFSIYLIQTPFPFHFITSSIIQNHSLWKIVPHLYWRRIRTNSRRETRTQLFSPIPI